MNKNKVDTTFKNLNFCYWVTTWWKDQLLIHSFNKSEILIKMSLSILIGSLIMHGSLPQTPEQQQSKPPTGTKGQGQGSSSARSSQSLLEAMYFDVCQTKH